MEEIWKPIPGFPEYEVSSIGRVRSLPRKLSAIGRWGSARVYHYKGRVLKLDKTLQKGYSYASLNMGQRFAVHRLVVSAFIGEIPRGMSINHKNGIRTDNRVENLEIVSHLENVRHAHFTGLRKKVCGKDILSAADISAIRFFWTGAGAENRRILCKIYDRSRGNLSKISRGFHYKQYPRSIPSPRAHA